MRITTGFKHLLDLPGMYVTDGFACTGTRRGLGEAAPTHGSVPALWLRDPLALRLPRRGLHLAPPGPREPPDREGKASASLACPEHVW